MTSEEKLKARYPLGTIVRGFEIVGYAFNVADDTKRKRSRHYIKLQCVTCGTQINRANKGESKPGEKINPWKCRYCYTGLASIKVGDVFGGLVVTELSFEGRTSRVYCDCRCGEKVALAPRLLLKGIRTSCGKSVCLQKYHHKPHDGKYLPLHKLRQIQNNAKTRNISCTLTLADLEKQLEKQDFLCAYTGLPLFIRSRYKWWESYPESTDLNHVLSCDRIDSSKGYVANNIQWTLNIINKMKLDLPEEQFIEYCTLVAKKAGNIL